jgi:cytochrome c oxidase subunit 1
MEQTQTQKPAFFSLGLVKGILGFIIGYILGIALTSAIRLAMGLQVSQPENYGLTQGAWVTGAIFGAVGFMLAHGVLHDWIKEMRGEDVPEHPQDAFPSGWARYLSASYDHKAIGIQYGVTSLIVLLMAGLFALIFRTQLALNQDILGLREYNTIMTLHGIVMIGGILLGVGAMSNYLVPLMIGANDMSFPRLNAFAFWINIPGILILLSSLLLGGLETGWTGYPPLSARAPLGANMFLLGVYFIGLSSILGSLNIITTIIRERAKGMTYFRMPILVWAAWATAIIGLTATQLIGLSFQMVLFERIFGMGFFDGTQGGNPLLFQNLFWFYSHPAVYVFVLVGLGVIS